MSIFLKKNFLKTTAIEFNVVGKLYDDQRRFLSREISIKMENNQEISNLNTICNYPYSKYMYTMQKF